MVGFIINSFTVILADYFLGGVGLGPLDLTPWQGKDHTDLIGRASYSWAIPKKRRCGKGRLWVGVGWCEPQAGMSF